MYNKVILIGNLTRDVELRYLPSGSAVAKMGLATNRQYTQNGEKKDETCFIDITLFGRSGEVANQYLRKGSKVLIEGRLVLEQWTDQQGQKRSKHSVVGESMKMLDSRQQSGDQEYGGGYNQQPSYDQPDHSYAPQQPQQQQPYQNQPAQGGGNNLPEIDINEDEIPF